MFIPEYIKVIWYDTESTRTFLAGSTYFLNKYVESGDLIPHDYDVHQVIKDDKIDLYNIKYYRDVVFGIDIFKWYTRFPIDITAFITKCFELSEYDNLMVSTFLNKDICNFIGITINDILPYFDKIESCLIQQCEKRKKDAYILQYFLYIKENNSWDLTDEQLEDVFRVYKESRII